MDHEKTLKSTSVFIIAVGVISFFIAVGVVVLGAEAINLVGGIPKESLQNSDQLAVMFDEGRVKVGNTLKMFSAGIAVSGTFMVLISLLNIVRGVLGFKISKGYNEYTIAFLFGVVALVYDIFGFLFSFKSGWGIIAKILYLLASGLYVYCIYNIKQEREAEALLEAEAAENGESEDEPGEHIKTIDEEAEEFFK